ncbi:hypothetical protein B0H14DRAFT_3149251 [Mycena olivaceomarginata]|nr:hypothetical protein B0H14DRAFT_3149251 [Mycena olivaceomarginata]
MKQICVCRMAVVIPSSKPALQQGCTGKWAKTYRETRCPPTASTRVPRPDRSRSPAQTECTQASELAVESGMLLEKSETNGAESKKTEAEELTAVTGPNTEGDERGKSRFHIVLPRISPTLEFLVGITSLFPELRELSIEFTRVKRGFHCRLRRYSRTRVVPTVDARSVDLDDDAAFDDLPVHDISDVEAEEPTIIAVKHSSTSDVASSSIHEFFDWISSGSPSLPPTMEVLRVYGINRVISLAQQHQAIADLGALCPLLREVQFGSAAANWKRSRELWKLSIGAEKSVLQNQPGIAIQRDTGESVVTESLIFVVKMEVYLAHTLQINCCLVLVDHSNFTHIPSVGSGCVEIKGSITSGDESSEHLSNKPRDWCTSALSGETANDCTRNRVSSEMYILTDFMAFFSPAGEGGNGTKTSTIYPTALREIEPDLVSSQLEDPQREQALETNLPTIEVLGTTHQHSQERVHYTRRVDQKLLVFHVVTHSRLPILVPRPIATPTDCLQSTITPPAIFVCYRHSSPSSVRMFTCYAQETRGM